MNLEAMDNIDNKKVMVYLAVPYTPIIFGKLFKGFWLGWIGKLITWYRFKTVSKVAAKLIGRGKNVFSPISHSHVIPLENLNGHLWLELDYWFVKRADVIYVLDLWGWNKSSGVLTEIDWGRAMKKYIYLIDKKGQILQKLFQYYS